MKKILFFCSLLLTGTLVNGQQNFVMYNMPYTFQRSYLNPALVPKSTVQIGLPALSSIYVDASNSEFSLNDLITRRPDDSLELNIAKVINMMDDNNEFKAEWGVDLFSFGLKLGKNYLSLAVREKVSFNLNYPKDLFQLIYQGNGPFIGETLDFDFDLSLIHYREYAVGYSRNLFQRLQIGARVKYLYGMENISTEEARFTLHTNAEDFSLTATSNLLLHTSGLSEPPAINSSYLLNRKNTGWGIDLGAAFRLNDRFSFSASILDLGYIKWNDHVKSFHHPQEEVTFTFNGFDLQDAINDTSGNTFGKMLDSMTTLFALDSSTTPYKTMLPTQFYAGAKFHLTKKMNAGLLFHGVLQNGRFQPGVAASFNMQVGRFLAASIHYAIFDQHYANIGLGFTLNLGPVQWYVMSDNVLGAIRWQDSRNAHIHTGINLVFGRKKIKKKDSNS